MPHSRSKSFADLDIHHAFLSPPWYLQPIELDRSRTMHSCLSIFHLFIADNNHCFILFCSNVQRYRWPTIVLLSWRWYQSDFSSLDYVMYSDVYSSILWLSDVPVTTSRNYIGIGPWKLQIFKSTSVISDETFQIVWNWTSISWNKQN